MIGKSSPGFPSSAQNDNNAMTPDQLIAALALPIGPPPRRVPKASLSDHAPTAADRRLIDSALARLDWTAGLNPANIGVPAGEAEGLTIDTINLLSATTRGPMPPRLAEILHRAIPKPVILNFMIDLSGLGRVWMVSSTYPSARGLWPHRSVEAPFK